jgi:CRISPR-associated protein Cas1
MQEKMTQKNQRNHYNVKLLRGYGVSISLKNNHLVLKNGQNDITGISDQEEWFVSKIPYEKIVISGKGYVSTEAISLLNQNNINVILTDTYGNPISFMNGAMVSNTAIKYRMGQYDTFRNPEKVLHLQKWILQEKIQLQINFFDSLDVDIMNGLHHGTKYANSENFIQFLLLPKTVGSYFNTHVVF